jgi:hypothetical protein
MTKTLNSDVERPNSLITDLPNQIWGNLVAAFEKNFFDRIP